MSLDQPKCERVAIDFPLLGGDCSHNAKDQAEHPNNSVERTIGETAGEAASDVQQPAM